MKRKIQFIDTMTREKTTTIGITRYTTRTYSNNGTTLRIQRIGRIMSLALASGNFRPEIRFYNVGQTNVYLTRQSTGEGS